MTHEEIRAHEEVCRYVYSASGMTERKRRMNEARIKHGKRPSALYKTARRLGLVAPKVHHAWTDEQNEIILDNIHRPMSEIGKILARNGHPRRTDGAIRKHSFNMDISVRQARVDNGIFDVNSAADFLGVAHRSVQRWIVSGELVAYDDHCEVGKFKSLVKQADLIKFALQYPTRVNAQRFDFTWFASVIEKYVNLSLAK